MKQLSILFAFRKSGLLSIALVMCLFLNSQSVEVYYNIYNNPAGLVIRDSSGVKKIKIDNVPANGIINFDFHDSHYSVNLFDGNQVQDLNSKVSRSDDVENYEPGILPEGDLVIDLEYSTDGAMLAAVYQHNDVVYFFDSKSYEELATIEVGRGPIDIEFTDSLAYVCCRYSKEVYKIRLSDFSIENIFSFSGDHASKIDISYDGAYYYVSCYSWMNGSVEGYNAKTGENLFITDSPYIHRWSILGIQGRSSYWVRKITLSPSENIFAGMISPIAEPAIFDGVTGGIIKHYTEDGFRNVLFSTTGDTLFLLTVDKADLNRVVLRRILTNDFSVIDSITTYQAFNVVGGLAANAYGTKFLSTDRWNEFYYFFDFEEDTCYHISENNYSIGSQEILTSANKQTAWVQVENFYRLFDFESGQFISTTPYEYHLSDIIDMNPVEDKFAIVRQLGYGYYDKFYTFDFTRQDSIYADTMILAGELPEADVVSSSALSNSGDKLFAVNSFSSNLSIINYPSGTLDTLIYMPKIRKVKTIPNSNLIFLYGKTTTTLFLFDPDRCSMVKEINLMRINKIFCTDNGQEAFAVYTNGHHGMLYKIEMDGENSEVVEDLYFRTKSCSTLWLNTEPDLMDIIDTKVGITPDKKYILSGNESENGEFGILVISTDSMKIVATIPTNDGCVFGWAFTSDSKRACALTSPYEKKPIVYIDGENSYIENEIQDDYHTYSATYNPDNGYFYILDAYERCLLVDPLTGNIIDQILIKDNLNWQIALDNNNKPVIRQSSTLWYDRQYFGLLGSTKDFSYHAGNNLFIIPLPGPDAVSVFDPLTVNIRTFPKKPVAGNDWTLSPNPANEKITVISEKPFQKIEIFNVQGKKVYSGIFNNLKTTIPVYDLKEGIYFVTVYSWEKKETKKLVISR